MAWILLLASCKMEAVNLDLRVFPDSTGRVSFYGIYPSTAYSGQPTGKDADFKGVRNVERVSARIEAFTAEFLNLNECDLGGITGKLEKVEEGYSLSLSIPVGRESLWYKRIGVGVEEFKTFEAISKLEMFRDVGEEAKNRPLCVLLSVELPGLIKKQQLDDGKVPEGWRLEKGRRSVEWDSDPNYGYRATRALLFIPVKDILKNDPKTVVWQIHCGKETADCTKAWKEFKKKHEDREK